MTPEVTSFLQGEEAANPGLFRQGTLIAQGEGGNANERVQIFNYNQAKNHFVSGNILTLLKHYFGEFPDGTDGKPKVDPIPVWCVRPNNSIAGSVDPVIHVRLTGNLDANGEPETTAGTGLAAVGTPAGNPTGSRTVIIEILKDGASETATYRKSTDGGISWGSEITTPVSGASIVLDVGVTVAFTDDATTPADSFRKGDRYIFGIKGPSHADLDVLDAVESEKRNYETNHIYIAHPSSKAFWTSVATLMDEAEVNDHNYLTVAICEAEAIGAETVADFYQARVDEANLFENRKVSVTSSWGASTIDGQIRNMGIAYFAKLSVGQVNQNPGWVDKFKIRTFSSILHWDAGYRDYMDAMHDAGLVVCKIYDDYPGIFIAAGQTMDAAGSPYRRVENVRRGNKIRRIVRQECIPYLKSDINPGAGGGVELLTMTIDRKIGSQMTQNGEITRAETELAVTDAGNGKKKVSGKVKFYEAGTMDAIEVDVEHNQEEV